MKDKNKSIRKLIGINEITDYSVKIDKNEEIVSFLVKPSNVAVLSYDSLNSKIFALMNVLKSITEVEMCCLNSRESFESNKRFLTDRIKNEENPLVRGLLEEDLKNFNRIQAFTATAREFIIQIRLKDEKQNDVLPYLSRIEKSISEQGFDVKRAEKDDIKRILAVYFEQNVTAENFEDFDGQRWTIGGQ